MESQREEVFLHIPELFSDLRISNFKSLDVSSEVSAVFPVLADFELLSLKVSFKAKVHAFPCCGSTPLDLEGVNSSFNIRSIGRPDGCSYSFFCQGSGAPPSKVN